MGRGKSQHTLDLIEASREILREIQPATVRTVCYRLFTRGLIESMKKTYTNMVSTQLVYAREHGIVPWDWIVDETREAEYGGGWENPAAFVGAAKRSYRRNRWSTQPRRLEVWSEKGSVRGTLAPVLEEYGVTFRVMHGYPSATAVYQVADENRDTTRSLLVFYVGDWDPSGLHMSEIDIPQRLLEYINSSGWMEQLGFRDGTPRPARLTAFLKIGEGIDLRRLALTEEDVEDPRLPSFSAETKRTDTRWRWFTENYGGDCWELDGLNPNVLRARVRNLIRREIDEEAWDRAGRGEAAEQETLTTVLGRWQRSISRQATK